MRKILIFSVALILHIIVNGQSYDVKQIPDSLLKNADAVKRSEELTVIIKSPAKVIVRHKYAITILNENGDDYAQYYNSYSDLGGLSDIAGTLYDATGKKLKSVKRKDIQDMPLGDAGTLMNDDRIKMHNFNHRQYPYTIEYEDEMQMSGTYFLRCWSPITSVGFSVEKSQYRVETPPGYKLRYHVQNISIPAIIQETAQGTSYVWELKHYKAILSERLMPPIDQFIPLVLIGANEFAFGKYAGNMSSWSGFGKFQALLNEGRDQLPENIRMEVHRIADKLTDTTEKIKKLYEYLQNSTRYISIQMGIGGWQPLDAKFVAEHKYGDCKALSNYMISLLKEAGIKSNYAIVFGGSRQRTSFREDFPSPYYFNHAVVCVPRNNDTTWLECTNQTESAGFMGEFTGNRKAILVDNDGGHVVSTPVYTEEQNLQLRKIKARIDDQGKLLLDVSTHFTGTQQENAHEIIHYKTTEERKKYLNQVLSLSTYSIDAVNYKQEKGKIPSIDEYLQITAPEYASINGKRLFITPNFFNKSDTRLSIETQRKYPISFSNPYTDVDSIEIQIPKGYSVEAMPKNVSQHTVFGTFDMRFDVKEEHLYVVRRHKISRSYFSPEFYPEVVKYFDTVYKTDRSRIVFVKKEN